MRADRRRAPLLTPLIAGLLLLAGACAGEEGEEGSSGTTTPATSPVSETAPVAERLDIEIAATGLTQMPAAGAVGDTVTYGVVLRNPNDAWTASSILLNVEFYNEAGQVAGTDTQRVPVALPGFPAAAGNTLRASGVDRMEVKALVNKWYPADPDREWGTLSATDVIHSFPGVSPITINGQLTSTWNKTLKSVRLVAIEFAEDGSIVGGETSSVPFIAENGTSAFSITKQRVLPPTVARIEIVATPANVLATNGG